MPSNLLLLSRSTPSLLKCVARTSLSMEATTHDIWKTATPDPFILDVYLVHRRYHANIFDTYHTCVKGSAVSLASVPVSCDAGYLPSNGGTDSSFSVMIRHLKTLTFSLALPAKTRPKHLSFGLIYHRHSSTRWECMGNYKHDIVFRASSWGL